jgi:RHH-type proline utilization regulon transcriptional repressor/proline dehydrogenase/delta 1-pyrroline-5-carboxylate dehydrogenase
LGGADDSEAVWRQQAEAALAAGNRVSFAPRAPGRNAAHTVSDALAARGTHIAVIEGDWDHVDDLAGVLAADASLAGDANRRLATRDGARLPVIEAVGTPPRYPRSRLVVERVLTVNTTAAGGNATLVAAMD